MTLQDDIQLSLRTWYPEKHKLHYDFNHPLMKLAGEAGEILDLYAKHEYKPLFNWWQCKLCGATKIGHTDGECMTTKEYALPLPDAHYTPLVLDELGDWFYYWRILAYLTELDEYPHIHGKGLLKEYNHLLSGINYGSALLYQGYLDCGKVLSHELNNTFSCFGTLIGIMEVSLADIVKLNYQKLNSEETHHGWKGAR